MQQVLERPGPVTAPDARAVLAAQQPPWAEQEVLSDARRTLAASAGLVSATDVTALRAALAAVAAGEALVAQVGDCAEDPAECTADMLRAKAGLAAEIARALAGDGGRPVLQVGRIAGQFAKPRSRPTEIVDGWPIPVFRGHLVNDPAANGAARAADPRRLVAGYQAARAAMGHLGWLGPAAPRTPFGPLWTSHEALVLDYEEPLVRSSPGGPAFLTSTHWPWIGDRTRQLAGAHVQLLSRVENPVACKVGPDTTPAELVALCAALDPQRAPGRLTLIARLGSHRVGDLLPDLVRAVRAAGHPVIWLVDPMHGNTVPGPGGLKTRFLSRVRAEVVAFRQAVEQAGGVAAGVHLECTPHPVTECVEDETELHRVPREYSTLCDPRLDPAQACDVAGAWHR